MGRELVAYHEAGHAVAAAVFGHGLAYVTIESSAEAEGHARFTSASPNPDPQFAPEWPGGAPEPREDLQAVARFERTAAARLALAQKRARERLVIGAAASAAEVMAGGENLMSEQAGSDRDNIVRILSQFGAGQRVGPNEVDLSDEVEAIVAEAEQLVRSYWPAVERVAEELVRRDRVNGSWVRRAVAGYGTIPAPFGPSRPISPRKVVPMRTGTDQ